MICWFNKLDCCMKTEGVLFQLLWLWVMGFIKFGCANLVCSLVTGLPWGVSGNCHIVMQRYLRDYMKQCLFDSLCNRSLNFIRKCLNCDNILVNFVSRHAVFYSRMCSVMGRNVQYFCERFGACSLVRQNAQLNDSHHTHGWGCIVHVNTVWINIRITYPDIPIWL